MTLSLSLSVINTYWLQKIEFWVMNATVSTQTHCHIPTRANGILSKLSYYIWQMNFQRMLVLASWSRTIILSLFEFTSKLNQCKIAYNYCISESSGLMDFWVLFDWLLFFFLWLLLFGFSFFFVCVFVGFGGVFCYCSCGIYFFLIGRWFCLFI